MSVTKKRSLSSIAVVYGRLWFRRFPAVPYLLKWLLICLITGACIGSASAGFLKSLNWVTAYREGHPWLIAFLPVAGFMIGLLYHKSGKEVEAGNNLLIDTIHEPGKTVPFRMAPFVYLGTMATHLFGGSAGREGTALQMAGAIADQFSKPLRLSAADRKMLLTSALAAGFGSVFGTPLAGTVFALEVVVIGRLKYDALLPAVASAIIADLVTRLWEAHHTHYHIGAVPDLSFVNIGYAALAGLAFGLCAATFSKLMRRTSAAFRSLIAYPPLRPFAGGIIVAITVWLLGTTKFIGLGIPSIVQSFEHQMPAGDFAWKMGFTIITLASGFKGGEVTPLFFIGAVLGSALSALLPLPTGLLAGMGFVAVFAGATNTPLACTLMAIELFGMECGVYAAVACVVSYLLSGHNSIYGRQAIGSPKHRRFEHYNGRRLSEL